MFELREQVLRHSQLGRVDKPSPPATVGYARWPTGRARSCARSAARSVLARQCQGFRAWCLLADDGQLADGDGGVLDGDVAGAGFRPDRGVRAESERKSVVSGKR